MDLREWCVIGFVRTELADHIFSTYRGMSCLSFVSITPFAKQSEAHLASEWDCMLKLLFLVGRRNVAEEAIKSNQRSLYI